MPRIIEVTLPSSQTTAVLDRIKDLPELVSLRLEQGVSIQPPGDVITIAITNKAMPRLLAVLDDMGITQNLQASVATSRPLGLISTSAADSIRSDTSYSIWEEVDQELNKQSSMSFGTMFVMAMSGAIAATGVLTNALHVVIGAMVIAPGFEPITRFSLGLVNRSPSWRSGLIDTFKGYAALIAGVVLTALVLQAMGLGPSNTKDSYLTEGALLSYWTSTTATSLLVSTAAAAAGAFLILQERSVLTAGVMVALALVPAATVFGLGIATADMSLANAGLSRLGIETLLVTVASLIVFAWKFKVIEKRKMPT